MGKIRVMNNTLVYPDTILYRDRIVDGFTGFRKWENGSNSLNIHGPTLASLLTSMEEQRPFKEPFRYMLISRWSFRSSRVRGLLEENGFDFGEVYTRLYPEHNKYSPQ